MDLEIVETLNGGDLVKKTRDLSVINGIQNMVYLSLFGGNIEASTPTERPDNEQSFDWWGNSLLFTNEPQQQFNSLTEKTLLNIVLNSEGRSKVEDAINSDLEFMRDFANINISVNILNTTKLSMLIQLQQPENSDNKEFVFIWDNTLKELVQS